MYDAYEWGWTARFTSDGELYDQSRSKYTQQEAREFIREAQADEDKIYPVDPVDPDGERPDSHVTYSLRRRPRPVDDPDWEEVP